MKNVFVSIHGITVLHLVTCFTCSSEAVLIIFNHPVIISALVVSTKIHWFTFQLNKVRHYLLLDLKTEGDFYVEHAVK